MLAVARQRLIEDRQYTSWDRARLSVVVPIGVIVAVAIVCIVVAVLSSAQRADEVAVAQEKLLFSRAIATRSARVLREVESIAASDAAYQNVRVKLDHDWVERRVGLWLETFFEHNYVFVIDPSDRLIYARGSRAPIDNAFYQQVLPSLKPALDLLRGRTQATPAEKQHTTEVLPQGRAVMIENFRTWPAIVAAAAVSPRDSFADSQAPVVISVKLIDQEVMAAISSRLQLRDLRRVSEQDLTDKEFSLDLTNYRGEPIARYAWTPKQPGAEIVNSVIPYIAVALTGFALLAGFVLRYMRRTATAIAAGETRLRHLAMHDPLCGLPNRIFFSERLESVIDDVKNGSPSSAVFYIDLDHFKEVNDTLGHPVGDELIRNVTLRLSHTLRGDDLVARLGDDEFAVISSIGQDPLQIMAIANRIIAALCAPYSVNKQSIVIGASIGIAIIDRHCGGSADIMRYADIALYRAKNEGRNRACIYDAAMDADLSKRKLLEGDLRHAIENDGLRLLYQPVVNNSGEKIVGVEGLCRWPHPERGDIPPTEFIPVAEHSGLIIELGEWVLRRACLDGMAWPGLTVAVNVSPLQFRRVDFVAMVERILAETKFDPARLELEVTESTLLGNVETAEASMLRLKALGVRLALDDFGTGYSSLLYLRRFPFDKLKIDRSFVASIEKAADAAAIVHAVVSLGRGLGMKVTAEGVETADQHLFLRAAGVHTMQGYRFGKAMPAAEISTRLQNPSAYRTADESALAS